MRSWIIVSLILSCCPAAAGPLDDALRTDVARGFSGAVLIAKGDRVVFDRAYGSLRGVATRPNSKFWIASGGKQFASAAILLCADRGWLTLDDPLGRFVPGAPTDKRAITVRQLLAHLSGLDQTYAAEDTSNRDAAIDAILAKPVVDTPGKAFHYSNDNYELAAAIVEIASGVDYRNFVTKAFFRPLHMRRTGFSFTSGARGVLPAHDPTPERLTKPMWGEAGVYSTTHDLLAWVQALRRYRVLSRASTDSLFAPVAPIHEGKTALGWFLGRTARGTPTIFTRGNEDFGPNALIYIYPDRDITAIVLTHAGDADDDHSWSRFVLAQIETALAL